MPEATTHGVALNSCAVTAQGTPAMTVAVASGFVVNANTAASVAAGNATITTADATNDRIDIISVNSSGTVSVTAGTPAATPAQPDTTDVRLASVYVYSQANALYTGTITSGVIQDLRQFVMLSEPAETFAYTFLNSAQTGDPGSGNVGFDTTALNTLTTLYVNYTSPTWGSVSGTGGYTKLLDWLGGVTPRGSISTPSPYFLRLWSRKQPNRFVLLKVTSGTDHTTYITLTVSVANYVQNDLGAVGTAIPLSTDSADTILEFGGAAPPTTTNGQSVLGSDVTLSTVNTYFDAVNTGSLPAGTYFLSGNLHSLASGAGHALTGRIWDGTTTYAESEIINSATIAVQVALCAVVTLAAATTLKMSAASDTGTTDKIKAAVTKNSAGNFATILTWVRLA